MVSALYVAFWLQLANASAAATSVAILALPTRGQALDKALWRLAGTSAGVAIAVVIAGSFNGTRTPFLVAVGAWIALCAFAANLFDGNRAYAAVLGGYTVAIVAVANVDRPQQTFLFGIESSAAIVIAIMTIGIVNDVSGAPNVLPDLLKRTQAAHAAVRAFALRILDRDIADASEAASLFGRITALRSDALLLPTESFAGGARAAAARRAVAGLVREARAARILASASAQIEEHDPAWRARVAEGFDDHLASDRLLHQAANLIANEGANSSRLIAARSVEAVIERDRAVTAAIQEMATGCGPARGPRLTAYHSRQAAVRIALRIFVSFLALSSLLAIGGWPASANVLVNFCILSGLSAINPDPRAFAVGAAIAIPLAVAAVGVTEFLILDGVDSFPLLAMALLPTVLTGCLLVASGKPKLFGVGFFLNVYTPTLLSPVNPQRYDPLTYLSNSLFDLLAAGVLIVSIATVLPIDDVRRRGWMLNAARRELLGATGRSPHDRLTREDASFRAADRLGQLAKLKYRAEAERAATLTHALHLAEVTFSAYLVRDALVGFKTAEADEARSALCALDPVRLRAAGDRLCAGAGGRWAGANAARTAALMQHYDADLSLAKSGRPPA